MSTQTQKLTYEQYLKTPDIKARYDIVDGVMIMEVLGLFEGNLARVAMYGSGDQVSSRVLPDLAVAVNELFG